MSLLPDDRRLAERLLAAPPAALAREAGARALAAFGPLVTYSPKIFVPLTMLCRDTCHYCTFAKAPRAIASPYLAIEEVLALARTGRAAGCREALFTLGDRPETRYAAARDWLAAHGHESTLAYLGMAATRVFEETGLLPHLNPGVMDGAELARLRPAAASMGLMIESLSERLCRRGGPHFGSPDKRPAARLATIAAAGRLAIPFTTGILIGIGETRAERLEALFAIRDLHRAHGHIQEVIVQNFRAKPGTRMAAAPEPSLEDHCWSIAAARIILDDDIAVQAPPNLRPGELAALIAAGVNDWGGVSPVTADHVNPEAAWPALDRLRAETEAAGRTLAPRLAIGPGQARRVDRWAAPAMATAIRRLADGQGLARSDGWIAGESPSVPVLARRGGVAPSFVATLDRARADRAGADDIARLFMARGGELDRLLAAADEARAEQAGEAISFVVNRNINYANICTFSCGFCAFSKSRPGGGFRDTPYVLDPGTVAAKAVEAVARGATEVCLQGGIHPAFDGHTYRAIVAAVHEAAPGLHIHAFSPLEVLHGAETLGLSIAAYLAELKAAGLRSLPGTAAEILDDPVRATLAAGKISVARWSEVIETAHRIGLGSTATIMFGHVETYRDWATHLLHLRAMQRRTGGFTEFVPLPFVHARAPIWVRGGARSGPTWREALLMHAVARLVLGPSFRNIQTSWPKLGAAGAVAALVAGANDLGGTLMNESISRAAGAIHGQEMTVAALAAIAAEAGRPIVQRGTAYQPIGAMAAA